MLNSLCVGDVYTDKIYEQIGDLAHPTLDDYRRIQNYLTWGPRPFLPRLGTYEEKAKQFKIIGRRPREVPQSGMIPVNCAPDDHNHCILLYSSFNQRYPMGLKRLISRIASSDFKGHILHRAGGWPDAEGGSLVLAHLPYAFKVCFFKEAQRLGFKRAFWLDTSIVPLGSLNEIFKTIEAQGYFAVSNTHSVGQYFHPQAAAAMGVSFEEMAEVPSCSSGILGFDFTHEKGKEAVSRWYEITKTCEEASYSPRPDQNLISIILHQMEMTSWVDIYKFCGSEKHRTADTLFIIDREFVR